MASIHCFKSAYIRKNNTRLKESIEQKLLGNESIRFNFAEFKKDVVTFFNNEEVSYGNENKVVL